MGVKNNSDHVNWDKVKNLFVHQFYTVKQISGVIDVRPETIRFHLKRMRVNVKQPILNYDLRAARAAYESGMTMQQVSKETGIPLSRLVRALKLQGVKMRTKSEQMKLRNELLRKKRMSSENWEKFEKAFKDGMIPKEVASMFGVHDETVRKWAKARGIKMPNIKEGNRRQWQLRHEKMLNSLTVDWPSIAGRVRNGEGIWRLSEEMKIPLQVFKMGLRRMNVDPEKYWVLRGVDEKALIADHVGGLSIRAVAIKHKRSQYFVKKFLIANGVARIVRTSPIDFAPIVEDLDTGMSLKAVSRKYKHSHQFLKKYLTFAGVDVTKQKEIKLEEIKADLLAGIALNTICVKYHHDFRFLKRYLLKNGVDPQPLRQAEMIIAEIRQGRSIQMVARKYHVGYKHLRRKLIEMNVIEPVRLGNRRYPLKSAV